MTDAHKLSTALYTLVLSQESPWSHAISVLHELYSEKTMSATNALYLLLFPSCTE